MRKTPVALLACAVVVIPATTLIATPAQAAHIGYRITDCWTQQDGETVRIRIRDEGTTGRVRVSHPRATSVFRHNDVERVSVTVKYTGNGALQISHGNDHSFRTNTRKGTQVLATFNLRNGKKIETSCKMR